MDIEAKYKHTKLGQFLFNLCARFTKFILKHRFLYYLLAHTWGIFATLLGGLIDIVLFIPSLIFKDITYNKFYWIHNIKILKSWGGCEMGLMFLRDTTSTASVSNHEFGHTFQNCIFGPFTIFIVAIPSASRWWARTLKPNKKWGPYDAAWFEDAASQCGNYAVWYLNEKNKK